MSRPDADQVAYEQAAWVDGYAAGRTAGLADIRQLVGRRAWLRILHAVNDEANTALDAYLNEMERTLVGEDEQRQGQPVPESDP